MFICVESINVITELGLYNSKIRVLQRPSSSVTHDTMFNESSHCDVNRYIRTIRSTMRTN